jgi:membrane-bound serine protease (ClpP class)
MLKFVIKLSPLDHFLFFSYKITIIFSSVFHLFFLENVKGILMIKMVKHSIYAEGSYLTGMAVWSLLTILVTMFSSFPANAEKKKPEKSVYVIPVSGEVSPEMSAFIKRAVNDIPKNETTLIVFELDTFGGRVDSAFEIVDTIPGITGAATLAYVKTKAISAGSLIALSCNRLIMKQGTTIGDCAPISIGPEGPQMLGEKFQSPLRARFRALAKKNGYDENLAESMVSEHLEIIRVTMNGKTRYLESTEINDMTAKEKAKITNRKTVVKKGELLTMDDKEAKELGFSRASVADLAEALKTVKASETSIVTMKKNWTEHFLSVVILFTPFLMMIGFYAVYLEMKAPGFGAPGIVGLICLSLAFGAQYLVGLADYTELLIIVLGLVLLGFEVFVIPGFGIAGVSGFIFIAIGLVLSLQDFVLPKPSMPWQGGIFTKNIILVVGSYMFAVVGGLLTFRYVFPRLSIGGHGPYLNASLEQAHADSSEIMRAHEGDEAVALSYLRPSGKIKIGHDVLDAITEGEFIESGTPVVITRISGNRIIVSRKAQS